jgi:phosphonate transport system substrate-binding protein
MSETPIRFGTVPGRNLFTLTQAMQGLLEQLRIACERPVTLSTAFSYDMVLQGMISDSYDLVLLGPELYVRAVKAGADYTPKIKAIRRGKTSYRGMIIVRDRSQFHTLAGLTGRTMAYVDRESAGGYVFPSALLSSAGVSESDLARVGFCGSHDQVVQEVLNGNYDAGGCYDDARTDALSKTPERIDELRVLARTLPIPNEPIVFSNRLLREEPQLANRLVNAFMTMHESPEGVEAIRRLGSTFDRFTSSGPAEFDEIRHFLGA